jgi:hypothetical protein
MKTMTMVAMVAAVALFFSMSSAKNEAQAGQCKKASTFQSRQAQLDQAAGFVQDDTCVRP